MVPEMLRGANPSSTNGLIFGIGRLYLSRIGNSQELARSLSMTEPAKLLFST